MIEKTQEERPKTADEMAAEVAELMLKGGGQPGTSGPPVTASHQRAAQDPLEKAGGGAGGMPTSTKDATGGFTATAGGKVLDKAEEAPEEEEEGEGEEEEEGGEDTEKCAKKSEAEIVDADDLTKAMDALDAAAEGLEEPEVDRRAELAKALEQGTLSAEERVELLDLLGAEEPTPADAIAKSEAEEEVDEEPIEKGFEQVFSEEFSDDYDVSPFLEKFGTTVGAAMDIMREDLSKSASDQGRFNRALAKSFRGVANVIQSQQELIKGLSAQNEALAQRLGAVESQPVGRKSAATPSQARPLQKSFDGQADPADGLSKSEIYRGLHLLMAKHKDNGGLARNGEPIDRAVAALESGAQSISKSLLAEIKEVLS